MRVEVLMHKTAMPRMCKRLLMGERYSLPEDIAQRLVSIGKAEIIQPLGEYIKPPTKAVQPHESGQFSEMSSIAGQYIRPPLKATQPHEINPIE
jgi:hypothetical protein